MNRARAAKAGWLARPVWPVVTVLLAVLILRLPAFLLSDELEYFHLHGDDFAYLADCRLGEEPLAKLWEPHNAHVVPLFRLLTASLARGAGSAGMVPSLLGWATYACLVLVMLGAGHFVAWETRRMSLGLAAMVLIGVTTVMEPALTWYSAGQTLWAALAVVGMLVLLQWSRVRGSRFWLAMAAAPALAAPLLWSGGLVAGPVGWAYLRSTTDPRTRRAAWWPLGATVTGAGLILAFGWRGLRDSLRSEAADSSGWTRALWGVFHTAQAIPEALIARNLGLDVVTTASQAVVLCVALGLVWGWSRRWNARPSPMEASGALMVLLGFLLAYSFRGRFPFSSLRGLGWYNTIPQVGAVLFVLGWWSGDRAGEPGRPSRLSRGGALAVAGVAGVMLLLQLPRAMEILLHKAPPCWRRRSRPCRSRNSSDGGPVTTSVTRSPVHNAAPWPDWSGRPGSRRGGVSHARPSARRSGASRCPAGRTR